MRWSAAEQLLERECEPDRYRVLSSMASFADDEERCRCERCRPDLARRNSRIVAANRKRGRAALRAPAAINDLGDVLAEMRTTLIHAARRQLQSRGLDEQLAEDLVQEAMARWVAQAPEYRGPKPLFGWLRKTIIWLAAEGLRRRDLLDVRPLSLDEPWARA